MLLESSGHTLQLELNQPGYIRAVVRKGKDATKLEWARESDWRFMPTIHDERVGFALHPTDLAVNNVLALAGRDEPRDILDTIHLHRHVLGGLR
jgi:hypothetical protein